MKLYEINQEYAELMLAIEEQEGELTPEQEEALKATNTNYQDKAENIIKLIANIGADVEAFTGEIKRLQERKKTAENKIENLKEYLLFEMQFRGLEKEKYGTFSVRQNHSEIVNVVDLEQLPEEYKTIKIEPKKADIKKALKEGATIEGAELKANVSLVIR